MNDPLHGLRFSLDHRWTPPHMSDYLDEELSSRSQARLERHLAECVECRRLLTGLRAMLRALRGLSTPPGADAGQIAASVRLRLDEPGRS